MDPIEIIAKLGVNFVPFLFALCFHELAHGWVAKKKGDNTAETMGRLTMNPFVHADPIGTFILPIAGILMGVGGMNGGHGFIFGWAKPVPVNSRNLAHPKNDMFWIAAAGPLSNLMLAALATLMFVIAGVTMTSSGFLVSAQTMLGNFIVINLMLCVFNLIPLHPLDGGKVLARFIPDSWNNWLENNQSYMQIGLIAFFVIGGFQIMRVPMMFLLQALQMGAVAIVGIFV